MDYHPISQTRKMREQFSISIRKEKREQIFRTLRSKQRTQFLEQEQHKMKIFLDTPQKRDEWIHRKARDLSGMPDSNWRFIMNELLWSIYCFQGNGCFRVWIQTQIIKNICSLFHEDYIDLGLASEAAKLLGSIIYIEQEIQQTKTSYIAEQIFAQQIIPNLIQLADDSSLPHNQISYFITLIGNLALIKPTQIFRQGGLTVCIDWSLRMLRQKKINRAYLDQIYAFFYNMSQKIALIPANYNFSDQTFKLLNEFIQLDQSNEMLGKLLRIVLLILKTNKQPIYTSFLANPWLVKKTFQFSTHDQQYIRQLCWHIFYYITSSNGLFGQLFMDHHFLDKIKQAYEKEPLQNGKFDKITAHMMMCISNFSDESDIMKEYIIQSSVINIVFDSTHPDRSTNLRKDAFYCLSTLITTHNYNLFKRMIFGMPFLQKMTIGLDQMIDISKQTVKQLINALHKIIIKDKQVFKYDNAEILQILESRYNFSHILTKVNQKYHQHQDICSCCDQLFNMYSY